MARRHSHSASDLDARLFLVDFFTHFFSGLRIRASAAGSCGTLASILTRVLLEHIQGWIGSLGNSVGYYCHDTYSLFAKSGCVSLLCKWTFCSERTWMIPFFRPRHIHFWSLNTLCLHRFHFLSKRKTLLTEPQSPSSAIFEAADHNQTDPEPEPDTPSIVCHGPSVKFSASKRSIGVWTVELVVLLRSFIRVFCLSTGCNVLPVRPVAPVFVPVEFAGAG